jgi:HAMP domain-containing protein
MTVTQREKRLLTLVIALLLFSLACVFFALGWLLAYLA